MALHAMNLHRELTNGARHRMLGRRFKTKRRTWRVCSVVALVKGLKAQDTPPLARRKGYHIVPVPDPFDSDEEEELEEAVEIVTEHVRGGGKAKLAWLCTTQAGDVRYVYDRNKLIRRDPDRRKTVPCPEGAVCPICLDPIGEQEVYDVPCGHAMHRACFDELPRSPALRCPLCRDCL